MSIATTYLTRYCPQCEYSMNGAICGLCGTATTEPPARGSSEGEAVANEPTEDFGKLLAAYTFQCELWARQNGDAEALYASRKKVDAYVSRLRSLYEQAVRERDSTRRIVKAAQNLCTPKPVIGGDSTYISRKDYLALAAELRARPVVVESEE